MCILTNGKDQKVWHMFETNMVRKPIYFFVDSSQVSQICNRITGFIQRHSKQSPFNNLFDLCMKSCCGHKFLFDLLNSLVDAFGIINFLYFI